MSMVEERVCSLCTENGHNVEMVPYESREGHFCPCCDRLDAGAFHDIKEESDFEWPEGGEGPSELS